MAEDTAETGLSFERIVFFSDAVFAIVITLLVLEIKPPHLEHPDEITLRHALFELLPKFTGFVVSFLIVGIMWIEHHRIFRYIGHYDSGLLRRNLLMLLCISFVPFPTALFSEFYFSRTAFVLYTASFACVALTKLWIWHYAVGNGLVGANVSEVLKKRIARRSWAVPMACALAIMLSLVNVFMAPIAFAFIPLFARLLEPRLKPGEAQVAGEES
jgi:uncharacterized membrane protein